MTGDEAVNAQTARIPQATALSSLKCNELVFCSGQSHLAALNTSKHKSLINSVKRKSGKQPDYAPLDW